MRHKVNDTPGEECLCRSLEEKKHDMRTGKTSSGHLRHNQLQCVCRKAFYRNEKIYASKNGLASFVMFF